MQSGTLIYRCRNCREKHTGAHVQDGTKVLTNLLTGEMQSVVIGRNVIRMRDTHKCENGAIGVSDLIGCELDKGR